MTAVSCGLTRARMVVASRPALSNLEFATSGSLAKMSFEDLAPDLAEWVRLWTRLRPVRAPGPIEA